MLDLFALAAAQQPVVDEDASQAIPDGAVYQGRRDRRVHTSGQAADRPSVRADERPNAADLLVDEVPGRPIRRAAANVEQKVVQDLAAARGVRDLGVKQHAEDRLRRVLHPSDRRIGARRGHAELGRRRLQAVTVARPHDHAGVGLKTRKQALAFLDRDLGAAVLTFRGGRCLAARQLRDELHAVTNAEHRRTQVENPGVDRGRARVEHGIGAAGQNDPLGVERSNKTEVRAPGGRVDLAVDTRFAYPAGDELRELRPAIENENAVHALYHVVGSAVSPRTRSSSVSRWRAT